MMKKQICIQFLLLFFTVIAYSQTIQRIEAESFNEASGARSETNANLSGGGNVGYITNGTWIKFTGHVFNQYDGRFDVAASGTAGGTIEFRLDAVDGTLIGTATVTGTSGWSDYQIVSATIEQTTGTHDLYLVFKGGSGYLFNLDYIEKVTNDPNAVTYTLVTSVTLDGSGTIASNVTGNAFVEGTEITLTANDNFGYNFVRWLDDNGTEVSTNNPYNFTITNNTTLVAEFVAVSTYMLSVNVEGAYGLGDYTISPTGKDGGFTEYEAGTVVTITALENDIVKFSNWNNGSTELSISVTMNQNNTVTGIYDNDSFIAGWTFKDDRYAHPRVAELYSNIENRPELFAYDTSDNTLAGNVRTNFRSNQQGFSVWNTNRGAFFYFMTSFSTVGYENINIQSGLLAYYYGCDEWTLQYSLDGENFIDLSSITTINGSSYTSLAGVLPTEAEGKDKVYIRWYPNVNGPTHGSSVDVTATLISNVSVKADEVYVDDTVAPVLLSKLPTDGATSASASGNIVLTFDEKVQLGTGDAILNGKVLTPEITNKTVKYGYYGLEYNTQYTFTLPAGAVTDLSGNLAEAVTISFRTLEKPIPAKRGFDLIVDANATVEQVNSGQYVKTIADAFNTAPSNSSTKFLVLISDGTYYLGGDGTTPQDIVLTLPSGKNNVSLIAQSKNVILQGNPAQGIKNAVLSIKSNDLYMENITVEHIDGIVNSGQKPALNSEGDRNVYNGVKLRSKQDTQLTGGIRSFFYKSTIEGDVDFICGGGTHWYEECNLNVVSGGYIVAPAHDASLQYGYVFNKNTITAATSYYLGRPWQNAPRAVYLNTTMVNEPHTVGWANMAVLPAIFAEYSSVNAFGVPVNTNNRTNVFTVNGTQQTGNYNPVLTQEEASAYTIENVLGGNDNWNPLQIVEQIEAPSNLTAGAENTLSWNENQYAICYVISRDGKILGITTGTSFQDTTALPGVHTYIVQAANEYGGLSTPSTIEMTKEGELVTSTIAYINSIDSSEITGLNPVEYYEGIITTLPTPTLSGYTFYGWSESTTVPNTISEIPTTATGTKVFYAFWGNGGDNQPNATNPVDFDYIFTAATNKSWDNPENFTPAGQPQEGDLVSCEIEIETTSNVFKADLNFSKSGALRLRGAHSATGTLIFNDNTSVYYFTSGAGMSLEAPIKVVGNLACNMNSSIENETMMTLSGPIFGNGTITPINVGRGTVINKGVLFLKGNNIGFNGIWDLTKNSPTYPTSGYITVIEGNSANAFGMGTINVGQNNYVVFSHERAASEELKINFSENGKAVLNSVVNVQKLFINGSELGEGVYDKTTHPQFFEGNGRIEVTSEYSGGIDDDIAAFPGAEGHGKYVTGGRGGRVIYVSNLNDNGPGSLRDAINQSGPRIVVFKVSGTIQLESELNITDNITIAGQTAPGGGITLRDYPVKVRGNNVIIRYLRFRMGDSYDIEDDALGGRFQENILIDHCSMSWSTDECVSFYENKNFTLQWCIITESLANSVHQKGAHGYGGIWGGLKASFHHNLLSHHSSRTPRFGEYGGRTVPLEGLVDMRNNVIYNWNGEGCYGGDAMNVNMVNNYFKPGPATEDKRKERIVSTGRNMDETSPMYDIWGRFYIDGNIVIGSERATNDNWTYGVFNQFHSSQGTVTDEDKNELRINEPHNPGEITTHNAAKAYELVLDYAGASLYRDSVDERAVGDTRTGTATIMNGGNGSTNGFIDTPSAAGGWPELPTAEAPLDSDSDGMPDAWENARGLNPQNPIDANLKTVDGVYTNIEVYINSLVSSITNNQNGSLEVYVTPEDFLEKYGEAEDGSKFIMAGGTYNVGQVAIKNHSYTFVPNGDVTPVFAGNFYTENQEVTSASFSFDGINIDLTNGNDSFMQFKNGAGLSSLEIKNSSIKGIKQSLLLTEGASEYPISKIAINNCLIDARLAQSNSFIKPDARLVNEISLTNSTLFGYENGQNIIWLGNRNTANQSINLTLESNTIYNACTLSSGGIVKVDNTYSDTSTFTFKNNIIQDTRSQQSSIVLFNATNLVGAGKLFLDNNLILGVVPYTTLGTIEASVTNEVTLQSLGLENLAFPKPGEGEFSFTENSPLATAALGGGILGDPRWLKENVVISSVTYINSINGQEITGLVPNEYIQGIAYNLPLPVLNGYTFFSWSSSSTSPEIVTEIPSNATGNKVFYAFWGEGGNNVSDAGIPVNYRISYENLPILATNTNQSTVKVGVAYQLNEAKAPGYRFLGWFTDANYMSEVTFFGTEQYEDVILYSRWKKLAEFYAYPTITNSITTLKSSETLDTVLIINALGITVKEVNITNSQTPISFSNLNAGVYVIKSSKTGMVTRVVVK